MRTFGEALDKATILFNKTNKKQYIIYNHVKNSYRISTSIKYSNNEELANFVG
jgi:hypothetical protein